MPRPIKKGLEYFPFDVDFFEDEKIEAIFVEFGIKGEITAIKLLCAIYRNGYFIQWNERLKIKLLKNLPSISPELLDEIVKRLVKWDFFNESLFNSESILTSSGIQKRFFSVTKRRKTFDEYPYLLFNVCNNSVNVCNNSENVCNKYTKESKVKESKVNIIKESRETSVDVPKKAKLSPPSEKIDFVRLKDYFNKTFANILPSITSIDKKRQSAIKARMAEYGKSSIEKVFQLVLESDFLKGHNDRNWRADFDWIFKPTNYVKILEGNYGQQFSKVEQHSSISKGTSENEHSEKVFNGNAEALKDFINSIPIG